MNNKSYSISVIRFISMLMIIMCHILQGLYNKWAFWINVGVQIFFFLSGFLYGKKEISDVKSFYVKRLQKIFVPYLIVFCVVLYLGTFLLSNNYSLKSIIVGFSGLGGIFGNIQLLSHTWFVSYILLCYALIPFLQIIFKQTKFKNNLLTLLLFLFLLQFLQRYSLINIEVCWINNFILGYFYTKCCKDKKGEKIFHIMIFTAFVVIIPFAVIYQENLHVTLPSILNIHSNLIISYGHVLLGSVIFISLYKFLEICKVRENIVLIFSDKYSYYVYLVHQLFILNSFSVLFLTKYLFINILLIFIFSVLFAIILKYIYELLLSLSDIIMEKLIN